MKAKETILGKFINIKEFAKDAKLSHEYVRASLHKEEKQARLIALCNTITPTKTKLPPGFVKELYSQLKEADSSLAKLCRLCGYSYDHVRWALKAKTMYMEHSIIYSLLNKAHCAYGISEVTINEKLHEQHAAIKEASSDVSGNGSTTEPCAIPVPEEQPDSKTGTHDAAP